MLISAGWFLQQTVTSYDKDGNLLADGGTYQQRGAEIVYVFAEFLRDKGLLRDGVGVTRSPEFQLRFSDLTEDGQRFAKTALRSWMTSLDRAGDAKTVDASGLERQWKKHCQQ